MRRTRMCMNLPAKSPVPRPTSMDHKNVPVRVKKPAAGAAGSIMPVSVSVRKKAMGSLAPDSSSSTSRVPGRSFSLLFSRMEKTAAASVPDTTAPNRSDCNQGQPSSQCASAPKAAIVSKTPSVANDTPRHKMGLKAFQFDSNPPVKMITQRASSLICSVNDGLL